ncbi:MAG: hydroxymethylglutaryl-CoA synthase [Chloroflexi bacterium AL-W]|nr:hydroxymethylglutaryl-CoA synthase [Chloroflexi bacterium AL-N1]NOK65053.1 hydroxymethylglutaryl-CoA synthase [Chloroflexi bacterium AL-N10]NOK72680.1 hydroxymethylglutaryl-CoA synthase [Chloroflexi bacterium AL-N5]NOK79232.1 hydroxymethylglutaryl-CoA synthase [Chloroflexi bacterium AL-W]NOK87148.1 hydroxymethylglutaryl-CoA synthase [Chloroflexi bacterium AL-N15]
MMRPDKPVGLCGYGVYIPRYRIAAQEIARIWTDGKGGLPVEAKSIPGPDEDTITMAIEAGRHALSRSNIEPDQLSAVWVGSESHPYAVKPSGTVVAEALGATPWISAGDWEFACKAGSEALTAAMGLVGSNMATYALAIGADTAQGRPGDALEYTASAGAAALLVGPAEQAVATIEATCSYVSDTPDFFRRAGGTYPVHGGRFTGEPAYFSQTHHAATHLLNESGTQASDYTYAVFHQPNARFPQTVAKKLGFTPQQMAPGLLAPQIGNTYSAAALLGLAAILDIAQPGESIFVTTYGSGAGSDAYILRVTDTIAARRYRAPLTATYLARKTFIDYAMYAKWRGKLVME